MRVAILGYPQSGRSSLYRAASRGLAKGDVTAVPVPDPRFDRIVSQVQPKKITPATVMLDDGLAAISGSGRALSLQLLDDAKKAELLLHVVRAFESPTVPYFHDIAPIKDQENVDVELVLSDLQIVENRLERLKKSVTLKTSGSPDYLENALFTRLKPELESGRPIRTLGLAEDELAIVRNYQFLSSKPMVVVFNIDEKAILAPSAAISERISTLESDGTPAIALCASIEDEVAQLDPVDQPEFLESLGLGRPASEKVVRAVYAALGLITFFTAGENETRAWALRKGASALKAAATIHNDIAKGFIRAEVVHYADYDAAGSLDVAYSSGKMSLEGKEYVIQDGDLLHIRNKS